MAIIYDPHQKVSTNLIANKAQAITAGKYRMIFPADGPFYSDSAKLYSQGVELQSGKDYILTHLYPTSILRTARRCHGAIWLLNAAITGNITFTAHYLGYGKATPAQITAERAMNSAKLPNKCYWEDAIGTVYFPRVDIQFDRANWKGEQEVMNALGALATKMTTPPGIPIPFENSPYAFTTSLAEPKFSYNGQRAYTCKVDTAGYLNLRGPAGGATVAERNQVRGKQRISYTYMSAAAAAADGSYPVIYLELKQDGGPGITMEVETTAGRMAIYIKFPGPPNTNYVARVPFPKAKLGTGITLTFDIDTEAGIYDCKVTEPSGPVIAAYKFDFNNPDPQFVSIVQSSNVKAVFNEGLCVNMSASPKIGGTLTFHDFPGFGEPVLDNVYEMLVKWKNEVDKQFKLSPAIEHVTRKDNPHHDSWGWLRAIELNGIASDTNMVGGKDMSALAAAINAQLPKAANLSNKLLRRNQGATQNLSGSFTTHPGQTSVTGASATAVQSAAFFDATMALVASDKNTSFSYTAPQGLRLKSGANVMEVLPNKSFATFNGKEILTPLTVGPYLPGVVSGGDGLFYGVSTPSMQITGSGVVGVPFEVTWNPPNAAVPSTYALRQLTTVFGYSSSLVATPYLVQQLDALFQGKLLMSKATVNGNSLSQSVVLDKSSFSGTMQNIPNISDQDMPLSDPQITEFGKYSPADHVHDKSAFGIGLATTAVVGLIRYGGLVNDATLALTGDKVLELYDRTVALEGLTSNAGVGLAPDIIRFGDYGSGALPDAVTTAAYMLTVKPQVYYIRKQYPVPQASFNLATLYPLIFQDGIFHVYVDMKNNAAFYSVSDVLLPEDTTRTLIGRVETDDTGIVFVEILAVTRLGDFREMDEHAASVVDHISYKPNAAQLAAQATGPMSGASPLDYTQVMGASDFPLMLGMTHGLANWRATDAAGNAVPNLNAAQRGADLRFIQHPDGVATHRVFKQLKPICFDAGDSADASVRTKMNFTLKAPTSAANTVVEVALGVFVDPAGKSRRFSALVNNSNFVTNGQGQLVLLGFAIDFGTPSQVIIGAPKPLYSAAVSWATLGSIPMQITFRDGSTELLVTLQGLDYLITFNYSPTAATVVFAPGVGNSTFTAATTNLVPYLATLGLSVASLFKAGTRFQWGIGGQFDAPVTLTWPVVALDPILGGGKTLANVAGLLEHTSSANACRVYEETIPDAEVGLSTDAIRTAFIKRHTDTDLTGALFSLNPESLYITLDLTNKKIQAIAYRL